ncbi:uncharacterized protein LOC107265565 [Cephus cinctus]|uniref:Uncharacterized protein LOC107265565 n=1 Tax=Cephus cinctus TaxID=211228 RepID=A0AAJ7RD21_CEPCN|nr:uncharacterized protein LOC107265565 [Cephus cinctus]XP_024938666.1 uncharacterized protein LOC107265565 [Cephus cinctus]
MTTCNTTEKLDEVLQLFLLPDYNVVSTTYLDLLLSRIAQSDKLVEKSDFEYFNTFQHWVLKALETWSSGIKPCQAVTTFTLRLIGHIGKSEIHFHFWYRENLYNKICDVLNLHNDKLSVSVKMAYVDMLSSLCTHTSGRHWILESGVWKDVIRLAHCNQTIYVTRESQKFIWTLLLHESQRPHICTPIILEAARPFTDNTVHNEFQKVLEETYLDQNKYLCSTIILLTSIIENTMFHSKENTIPLLVMELTNLEARIKALFEACISTTFFQHIHKLLVLLIFVKLKQGISPLTKVIDQDVINNFHEDYCYIHRLLLNKKFIKDTIKTQSYGLVFWKKLQNISNFKQPNEHKFEHQVICLMVLPLFISLRISYLNNDLFETYIDRMFDITCAPVQRLGYNMREIIYKSDICMESLSRYSLDQVLQIVHIMDRDVAVITFQTMCHVLKNYMIASSEESELYETDTSNLCNPQNPPKKRLNRSLFDGDAIQQYPCLLSSILNGLAIITEKFKIKWQESVETICLLSLAQDLLNNKQISSNITVQALKICKLSIENFMPPQLALLVDNHGHIDDLGPTLYRRIHDPNWEVRDSVLETLKTIAMISEYKYPAFQKFLVKNDFLQMAVSITLSDAESYVRASALSFLAITVRINELWEEKLCDANLADITIQLMAEETEAIVRREAVILMKELYVHRKWSKSTVDIMSRSMAVAAVLDLHWEVKVNAIEYWKQFIISHFTDQGMLDGSFPSMTFSKEHRKIIALNETEIKRRIRKALDKLAEQSCLGILLAALEDESDFVVCKAAADVITQLKNFLLKYKIDEPVPDRPLPKDSATIDSSYKKESPPPSPPTPSTSLPPTTPTSSVTATSPTSFADSDVPMASDKGNILESIVESDDMNLLAAIYKDSLRVGGEELKLPDHNKLRVVAQVTQVEFLNTILNLDLNAYIEEKSRWLQTYTDSFESILDDILTVYHTKNVISMDCY